MEFVEITGASGAVYRFRRWPEVGGLAPIAGNYVLVDLSTGGILALGLLDDLSRARSEVPAQPTTEVFTRFNVSRAQREAEHADIAQQHAHLSTRDSQRN